MVPAECNILYLMPTKQGGWPNWMLFENMYLFEELVSCHCANIVDDFHVTSSYFGCDRLGFRLY